MCMHMCAYKNIGSTKQEKFMKKIKIFMMLQINNFNGSSSEVITNNGQRTKHVMGWDAEETCTSSWSLKWYPGRLNNCQEFWQTQDNKLGGMCLREYLDNASCRKFPSKLTRSMSSLKIGATSHASLQWLSGNATGSKANGACTMPTPGTFPERYHSNNPIIPISSYICQCKIRLMQTPNRKKSKQN